jgi:hypothetical protein
LLLLLMVKILMMDSIVVAKTSTTDNVSSRLMVHVSQGQCESIVVDKVNDERG